jgi:hypothetical protein
MSYCIGLARLLARKLLCYGSCTEIEIRKYTTPALTAVVNQIHLHRILVD